MSISIVSCPKCNTFLLSDTAQCHRCRHVLNSARAAQFRDNSLPADNTISQDSERCRQCGETYRKGLVRCWSCGAFTRPEIEDAYYRLLQGHAHHVNTAGQHYELPEISAEEIRRQYQVEDQQQRQPAAAGASQEIAAIDEDFELTGNLQLLEDQGSVGVEAPIPLIPETNGAKEAAVKAAEPNGVKQAALAKPATPPPPADETESLMGHAKEEETASAKARKARLGEGFVIFCPMGCKIRVQDRHRGKIGRCPKCQSTFVVPMARQTAISGSMPPTADAAAGGAAIPAPSSKFERWMQDVHLHKVVPQKLRIKADSLLKEFQAVDVGFDASGLILAALPVAGGMFAGKNAKKTEADRTAIQEHMRTAASSEGLLASFKQDFTPDAVRQIVMTQPSPPGAESLFGDIPVFGTGRVAVRLPKFDEKTTAYLSFSLSEFRAFARHLAEVYGIRNFGADCGIPLTDEYQTDACHVSKKPVKDLQNLAWYQKDPAFKLEVTGYRCKTCAAVVSEAARAAQKLGGTNGKAIAKAKCPKCTKPLGSQPLYAVPAAPSSAASDEEPSADEAVAPVAEQPAEAAVG